MQCTYAFTHYTFRECSIVIEAAPTWFSLPVCINADLESLLPKVYVALRRCRVYLKAMQSDWRYHCYFWDFRVFVTKEVEVSTSLQP